MSFAFGLLDQARQRKEEGREGRMREKQGERRKGQKAIEKKKTKQITFIVRKSLPIRKQN